MNSYTGALAPVMAAGLLCGAGWLVVRGPARPDPAPALRPDVSTQKFREGLDKQAHEVLDAFFARAYDPSRDRPIRRAEGTVTVTQDGVVSRWAVDFDASRIAEDQVRIAPADAARTAPADLPGDPQAVARRVAIVAVRGGAHAVLLPIPPTPLLWSKGVSGPVVTAERFRGAPAVSYSFDADGLVTVRGRTTEPVERTRFLWTVLSGRHVLQSSGLDDGSFSVRWAWTQTDPPALDAVEIREGDHKTRATIAWSRIEPPPR